MTSSYMKDVLLCNSFVRNITDGIDVTMIAMFRVDLQSKRAKLALRFFTYGVMTVATIVISALCILLALGYRFNDNSRSFEQGGLMQFRSAPQDAVITVDGKEQDFRTPGKLTVPAGRHDVSMTLEGYREWRKSVDIAAGQLLWLNYTRFIPNDITTKNIREFDTVAGALISPNRRFAVIQPKSDEPKLIYADIRDETDVRYEEVIIPAKAYASASAAGHTFELLEWQLDGRYLLVRHRVGDSVNEVLRLDRQQPEEAVNISAKYGAIQQLQFLGSNAGVVIALIGNELRRLEVDGETSTLLVNNVTFFELYRDDLIGFIAERNGQRQVGVYKDDQETLLAEFPIDETPLKVDVSNYYNDDYLAYSHGKTVTIVRNPSEATVTSPRTNIIFNVDQPAVEWLYFANNGRMLVAQHQASFTTYDLELEDTYRHSFTTSKPVTRPFKWFDDYNLYADLDGNLRIIEYDGTNERALTSVAEGYPVSISENGEAMFSFGKNTSNNRYELQRSNLIVEQP